MAVLAGGLGRPLFLVHLALLLLWNKVRWVAGAKRETLSNYYYKLPHLRKSLEDPAMPLLKVEGCILNDLANPMLKAGDIH